MKKVFYYGDNIVCSYELYQINKHPALQVVTKNKHKVLGAIFWSNTYKDVTFFPEVDIKLLSGEINDISEAMSEYGKKCQKTNI